MTGNVFYWSDLHLGHNKVAELRGFTTTEEHDAAIIDAWATTVMPRDTVWVLGDLTAGGNRDTRNALETIWKLPGTKRLITGNHDKLHPINRPRASGHTQRCNSRSGFGAWHCCVVPCSTGQQNHCHMLGRTRI